MTARAMNQLVGYPWPGNVRELKNFVEKLIVLVEETHIQPRDVSSILGGYSRARVKSAPPLTLKQAREEFERGFIREKLVANNWNVTYAAKAMGIPRTYLHKKIKRFGIKM